MDHSKELDGCRQVVYRIGSCGKCFPPNVCWYSSDEH